jgi:hypothetical protein
MRWVPNFSLIGGEINHVIFSEVYQVGSFTLHVVYLRGPCLLVRPFTDCFVFLCSQESLSSCACFLSLLLFPLRTFFSLLIFSSLSSYPIPSLFWLSELTRCRQRCLQRFRKRWGSLGCSRNALTLCLSFPRYFAPCPPCVTSSWLRLRVKGEFASLAYGWEEWFVILVSPCFDNFQHCCLFRLCSSLLCGVTSVSLAAL